MTTVHQSLQDAVEHLELGYQVADQLAGEDLLSPWFAAAASINNVNAWLRRHLPHDGFEHAALDVATSDGTGDAVTVATELEEARRVLLELSPADVLTAAELTIARVWLATAIDDVKHLTAS